MTRYLLDTTALIDFSKNREPARSRIQVVTAKRPLPLLVQLAMSG